GLNIGCLKALNWSLLAKWWWRFKTEKNSLWKKVVCSFHGSDGNLGVASDVGSPEIWSGNEPKLSSESKAGGFRFLSFVGSLDEILSVCHFIHRVSSFSVFAFRAIIDSKLLGHLGSKLRWNNLGKINILAWRIRNYRLPTRANIDKRGIDIHSILCPFCEEQIEDEDHIFALYTALNVLEMADDGDLNFGEKISSLFDVVVLCAIWWIWRARNLLVFQAVKVNMINIIDDIIATSYLWIKNRAKCSILL
ncbi:RNA-directed DNA polymerase, eukaryota, reverse transcriptase zinc-binding domain protein, partial [Tanacetum coccineum]